MDFAGLNTSIMTAADNWVWMAAALGAGLVVGWISCKPASKPNDQL